MANRPRFVTSQKNISKVFSDSELKAFSVQQMANILEANRKSWNLPQSMNLDRFIKQLIEKLGFKENSIKFYGYPDKKVYTIDNVSAEELAYSLFPKSYLSHYTALSLHALTEQIPKTIYITSEQSIKNVSKANLTQTGIDNAFKHPQRISDTRAIWNDKELVLLKGKYTGNLGVKTWGQSRGVRVTDLERTLIDIVVRPSYSGGVFEVLKAFRLAAETSVLSMNKLRSYLIKMNFIYPYHQAIGFYMDRSGAYSESQLSFFRKVEKPYKFYLTYDMKDMDYSKEWKLYFPKGM